MVQLKARGDGRITLPKYFQFLHGTIKRVQAQKTIQLITVFNSFMVQLKAE